MITTTKQATAHLWLNSRQYNSGTVTASATLECPDQEPRQLWFRVPEEYGSYFTDLADPFVVAVIFNAMALKADLTVHGTVSRDLVRNLHEFQQAWACWRPDRYTCIEIHPEISETSPAASPNNQAILAFSGGVDCCFSAWRHTTLLPDGCRHVLKAGLIIQGFDIPLTETAAFLSATSKAEAILSSVGLDTIPMATNYRDLGTNWIDSHGAAVAACLMQLQNQFTFGLIASSAPYNAIHVPWGSNPLTDPLLSSRIFHTIHDGAAHIRRDKIATISHWPEACRNLRVCWEGERYDRNCGRCEKCIRTILSFRVAGSPLPECFEHDLSDHDIRTLNHLDRSRLFYLNEILQIARHRDISASWVQALAQCVRSNRRSLEGTIWHRLRQKLQIRTRIANLAKNGLSYVQLSRQA